MAPKKLLAQLDISSELHELGGPNEGDFIRSKALSLGESFLLITRLKLSFLGGRGRVYEELVETLQVYEELVENVF